jgi:hypothetical protein
MPSSPGLAKGRGEVEIADREVVAQEIWPVQPVFQYAKGSRELLQSDLDR